MITLATDTRHHDHLAAVRAYYACFNARRFADAAAMFTGDAVLEQVPFHCRERGPAAYSRFADLWTRAFPDLRVTIEEVTAPKAGAVEVQLVAAGTHMGDLAIGGCVFRPTGITTTLHLRELLEFRDARFAASFVSFDLQELANQLARINDTELLMHLSRLRYMEDQLRSASPESPRRLALIESIGRELDAARHIVRPYFAR